MSDADDLAKIRRWRGAPWTVQHLANALRARAAELRKLVQTYPKHTEYGLWYVAALDEANRLLPMNGSEDAKITDAIFELLGPGCHRCGHMLAYPGACYCGAACAARAEAEP